MTNGMSLPKNPVIRFAPYGLLATRYSLEQRG